MELDLGLPYGLAKETTLRLLGLYFWLCDEEQNSGCIDERKIKFASVCPKASSAIKEVTKGRLDILPFECVAYFPYAHIVTPDVSTGFFDLGISEIERVELLHCLAFANCEFTVVLRHKIHQSPLNGDVGKPSRTAKKLLDDACIPGYAWTTMTSRGWVFIAVLDDPSLIMKIAKIFSANTILSTF